MWAKFEFEKNTYFSYVYNRHDSRYTEHFFIYAAIDKILN